LEGKVLFANLRAGDFEVGFMGSSADYPDAASFLTSLLSTEPGINYSHYNNPAYDALIARAAVAPDAKARADLMRQAEALMLEDQPLIPLYAGVNRELVSRRVHGWEPNPSAVHLSRYLSIDPVTPARQ
jgi:oligopeptide transport system substrate-binding protein